MTDYVQEVLDELVPRFDDERGDWDRVVTEVQGAPARPRRRGARRLVLVAVALVAIILPVVGAASQEWWFLRIPGAAPPRVSDVHVVETGSWDGQPWELAAYVSADHGICFSLAPTSGSRGTGEGAGLACAWLEGLPTPPPDADWRRLTITLMAGSSGTLPAFVVGPVVEHADEVAIHLADGTVLRTPTFDAPDELGSIRFYATPRPDPNRVGGAGPQADIQKLVGLTSEGEIVACLVVWGTVTYDLSDCA